MADDALQDGSANSEIKESIQMQKSEGRSDNIVCPLVGIKVLFFARARELSGLADVSIDIAMGSTAADCLSELLSRFPSLEEICSTMVLAVNEEYVPESTVLRNGDELAIIPPISGG